VKKVERISAIVAAAAHEQYVFHIFRLDAQEAMRGNIDRTIIVHPSLVCSPLILMQDVVSFFPEKFPKNWMITFIRRDRFPFGCNLSSNFAVDTRFRINLKKGYRQAKHGANADPNDFPFRQQIELRREVIFEASNTGSSVD